MSDNGLFLNSGLSFCRNLVVIYAVGPTLTWLNVFLCHSALHLEVPTH